QEAARQQAAQQEAARQEAARLAQLQADQQRDLAQRQRAKQKAQRVERLRATGAQLNQEAARRDAAGALRRGWLFGRADPNADMV
uniref:hypothetical protein n=1 Tax=Deinococcus sp. GbtcB9 TaxID=2824754 RepID=UPI001C2FB1C5